VTTTELVEGYPAPVYQTEVSGVPAFWSETTRPFSATLMFDVGHGDETLLTSGLTHLVEHLAMPDHSRHLFEVNARVEIYRSIFWAHGEPDEVFEFIQSTAAALASLPLERLEAERRILRAEGDNFGSTRYSSVLCGRFGARGPGLYDYPEYGLLTLGAEDAASWAETRFTAASAALWLTGAPPDGFELPLRAGARAPARVLPDAVFGLPLYVTWDGDGIAFGSLVERSVVGRIAAWIVRDRVFHELRHRHGVSYNTQLDYEPLTATVAHMFVSSDVIGGHEELACNAVVEALEQLASDGPTAEELEYALTLSERFANDEDDGRSWLDTLATDALLGAERATSADVLAALAAIGADDIARAVGGFLETMVLCLPGGVTPPGDRFSPLPPWNDPEIAGRRYPGPRPRRWKRSGEWMVVGDEGVSWSDGEGSFTVRYDDAGLLVCDGETPRVLHRLDGRWINFGAPAEWRSGERLLADIKATVPPQLVVDAS